MLSSKKRSVMRTYVAMMGLLGAVALLSPGCGGEAALGEECGEEGAQEGECEEGTVCGKPVDGTEDLHCLKVCDDQADCAADEECNGVEGASVKGCRTKTNQPQ
jgi:hypothetical protein